MNSHLESVTQSSESLTESYLRTLKRSLNDWFGCVHQKLVNMGNK